MVTCENKTERHTWYCTYCECDVDAPNVKTLGTHKRCGGPLDFIPKEYDCGSTAVIRYDGRNLCAECADEGVLALYCNGKNLAMNGWHGPDSEWGGMSSAIAALAPKEDV